MSDEADDARAGAFVTDDPEELVELLRVPDARSTAAHRLGELGYTAAAPELLRLLRAGDPYVRCAAAQALGELRAAEAVDPLVEIALTDDEGFVRSWSLHSLALIGDPRVAKDLRVLLDVDLKPDVAVTAARTLASLGDPVGTERFKAHVRSERWTLPSLRKARAERPPNRLVWLALTATWLAGIVGLFRWWEGWPQLFLGVALVLTMGELRLAARNAAARRSNVLVTNRLRAPATAATRVGAAAIAGVWTAVLATLLSFDMGQLGVYVSLFFFVLRIVLDADERRRARRDAA